MGLSAKLDATMQTEREKLEDRLGPPDEFVLSRFNIQTLRQWALAAGYNPVDVSVATGPTLTNWYHEKAGESKDARTPGGVDLYKITADIIVQILDATRVEGFNTDLQRAIARDEFEKRFGDWSELIQAEINRAIAALPPKRFEIVTPAGVTQMQGPLHYAFEDVYRSVSLAHPVMLVGPAGCGKTTIGRQVATAMNLPFYITSTITEPHELTGYRDGYGQYHTTPFRQAFEHGGVWVADEIDAWDASALLAANAALANGFAYFSDGNNVVMRNSNFRMVGTANTYGSGADRLYVGRNELDAASVDRFAVIDVDYDHTLEQGYARGNTQWLNHVWNVRKAVTEKKIRHVVSSRAIIMGALALEAGATWEKVEKIYLFKGMSEADRKKVQS